MVSMKRLCVAKKWSHKFVLCPEMGIVFFFVDPFLNATTFPRREPWASDLLIRATRYMLLSFSGKPFQFARPNIQGSLRNINNIGMNGLKIMLPRKIILCQYIRKVIVRLFRFYTLNSTCNLRPRTMQRELLICIVSDTPRYSPRYDLYCDSIRCFSHLNTSEERGHKNSNSWLYFVVTKKKEKNKQFIRDN